MRNLSQQQRASFTSDLLTIATLLDLTLNDGRVVKLTNHDVDIGQYKSGYGLDTSNVTLQLGGAGQTCSASMLPVIGSATDGIDYFDLESGALDGAFAQLSFIDWSLPTAQALLIFTGSCSEAKYGTAGAIELTLNTPLSQDRPICGDLMSKTCRADFGDSRCTVDIASMVDGVHVFAPIDAQSFKVTRDEVTPAGYYNNGTVFFNTGDNKGLGYEIQTVSKADSNGRETLTTKVPLAFDVAAGDYILLYPGCDKRIDGGCTYWNNTDNFQGEPFIADQSNILPPPTERTGDTSDQGQINTGLTVAMNWALTQYIKLAFNLDITFYPGFLYNYVNDGALPGPFVNFDVYTAIFNAVGGLNTVVAFDGTLQPKDTGRQALLTAAGFVSKLDLALSQDILADYYTPSAQQSLQDHVFKGTAWTDHSITAKDYRG